MIQHKLQYFLTDVFAERPFHGNPVAVFVETDDLDGQTMQRIAREMNLSETTFVRASGRSADYAVRIFTPVNELPFAGHPTLGTASVLCRLTGRSSLVLETQVGDVPFEFKQEKEASLSAVTMVQPKPTSEPFEDSELITRAFGLRETSLPLVLYTNGPRHLMVGVASTEELTNIKPDLKMIAHIPDIAFNCFAQNGSESHYRMRMFSPAYGVVEDAATGSAAGPLVLHLIRNGRFTYDQDLTIEQGVEMGRRSIMHVTAETYDTNAYRLIVGGRCVSMGRGELSFTCDESGAVP